MFWQVNSSPSPLFPPSFRLSLLPIICSTWLSYLIFLHRPKHFTKNTMYIRIFPNFITIFVKLYKPIERQEPIVFGYFRHVLQPKEKHQTEIDRVV